MDKFLSRIFPTPEIPEAPAPGVYQCTLTDSDGDQPERLHLRIERSHEGVLIVNASIVLHLNQTASEHSYWWIQGEEPEQAASVIAARYRVTKKQALQDHYDLREQVLTLSRTPDLDPVIYLDMNRTDPYEMQLTAPYRLDCALTYKIDADGTYDPNARARVDRELSTSEWKKILSKAWQAGIPHVTFTGGEPTLYTGLIDLIAHAESLGQITGLLTNGIRFNDPSYLDDLVMTGLDHLLVAVDFKVAETISGLQAAIGTNVFTAAHLSINNENLADITSQIEELNKFEVEAISLSAAGEDQELIDALVKARDHAAYLGMDLIWDLPVPCFFINPVDLELVEPLRGSGRAWLYVEPDGDVLPAQGIDEILGNMLRDDWAQIWKRAAAWS